MTETMIDRIILGLVLMATAWGYYILYCLFQIPGMDGYHMFG